MPIQCITKEQTYDLRSLVLRPGLPIESCYFKEDEWDTAFHLGCTSNKEIQCVASFYKENYPRFSDNIQYRLRGMATHPDSQGAGLGKQIMQHSIQILKEKHATLLWCHARTSAVAFYLKLGWSVESEEFEISSVGPHFVMSFILK